MIAAPAFAPARRIEGTPEDGRERKDRHAAIAQHQHPDAAVSGAVGTQMLGTFDVAHLPGGERVALGSDLAEQDAFVAAHDGLRNASSWPMRSGDAT